MVSGGDVANLPWKHLEAFVLQLLEIDTVRDIRLATKALMGLPQHWLQPEVVEGMGRLAGLGPRPRRSLAVHTHVNAAQSVTPLVAEATRAMLDAGVRTCATRACSCAGLTTASKGCSTSASRCRTVPASRRTTSTCAT